MQVSRKFKSNEGICFFFNKILFISDGKKKTVSITNPTLEITEPLRIDNIKFKDKLWASKAQADDIKVVNMVEVMERRTGILLQQLDDLRLENQRQADVITSLKCQVWSFQKK